MMLGLMRPVLLATTVWLMAATPAFALDGDLELWTFQDWYSPLPSDSWAEAKLIRVGLTQRFATRTGGFQHAVLRVGPQWAWGDAWSFGLHVLHTLEKSPQGSYLQEQRVELEPRWAQRWGPWQLQGRARLEARALPSGFRDRWRLSLGGGHDGWAGHAPFFSAEGFWEPKAGGLNQGRFMAGLSSPWWGQRFSAAFLLRPRLAQGQWLWDRGLVLNWSWKGEKPPKP